MKRILLGAGAIVFVAALVVGATGAFFSDTETSTGNTFAAGDIDLQIDNTSYVTSTSTGRLEASPANTWAMSNLTNQLFFSFTDVKPGDIGEDTISVHAGSNNAWACMAAKITATPENTLVDPETDAGDVGPAQGNNGELQNYLNFTFWKDDGDNVFEVGETLLPGLTGSASSTFDGSWHTLADSQNGPALAATSTTYIGKAWCFGTLTPNQTAQDNASSSSPLSRGTGFTCNGAGNQNVAQTDGIVVDVSFQAVQSRNNAGFLCSNLPPLGGSTTTPTTGTLIVKKVVVGQTNATSSDFTIHVKAGGVDISGSAQPGSFIGTTYSGIASSTYVVSENATSTPFGTTFSGDCNATSTVVVTGGSIKTCTITNTLLNL